MKRSIIVMLACVCMVAPVASRAADSCASDRAQIIALEDRFAAAVNAKNLDRIMSVYVPGNSLLVFDVVPPRQYVGWAAYKKDWEGFLAAFKGPIRFTIADLSIDCDDTLGFSHSIQRVTGMLTSGKRMTLPCV